MILRHKNRELLRLGRHFMRDLMASLGLNMRDPDFHRKALDFSLPRERLAVLERFLQKRVSDILEYGEKADECLKISQNRVGVKNKNENTSVGVNGSDLDALALQMIWNMKANPSVTARELAEILGVEVRTVERMVRALRENGVVRRVGAAKSGHWDVLVEF